MNIETIPAKDIDKYIWDSGSLIVDLRSRKDFERGHISRAINVEYDYLMERLDLLDYGKVLILYCERGATSLMAAKELMGKGYRVKSVVGGIVSYRGNYIDRGSGWL